MAGDEANGRVTTSQFYAAQLETQKMIGEVRSEVRDMKDEIMSELKPLMVKTENNETRSKNNETDIKENRDDIKLIDRRSTWWDGINSALVLIAGYLGFK